MYRVEVKTVNEGHHNVTQGDIKRVEKKMNGKIDPIDMTKLLVNQENGVQKHLQKMEKADRKEDNDISESQDDRTLQTLEEEDKNDSESSDDSLSVTISNSDSDSDSNFTSRPFITESTTSVESKLQGEYAKLLSNPTSKELTTMMQNGEISEGEKQSIPSNNTSKKNKTHVSHSSENIMDNGPDKGSTTESMLIKNLPNGLSSDSNDRDEHSTGQSSNIIFENGNRKDVPGKELTNSGMSSEDSEMKDRTNMLAELQKIVQEEQQMSSNKEVDAPTSTGLSYHDCMKLSAENPILISTGNISDVLKNEDNAANSISIVKNNDDDSVASYHGKNLTNGSHGNTQEINPLVGFGASGKLPVHVGNGGQTSTGSSGNSYQGDSHNTPRNSKNSFSVSTDTQRDTNPRVTISEQSFPLNNKESLENIEKKLFQLEESNTEQTAEIQQLKTVNDSLKTKFEKLEQSSGHHQHIEDQMLKKNEELEKHLLGVLKAQEIIFDMKEKLKAVTADNEKLTKDYQEAVKALEAVDRMFGQKDALVKKWQEATEESRRLVELLKKHNAEVSDLETVDNLKEEITNLKTDLSKAEEINNGNIKKNEEVIEQCKMWKKKFEHENEQVIKLNYELQEAKKELKNHQKLAGKRGRKNQLLYLELTELKDTLKLAKERMADNETKFRELEQRNNSSHEMYTSIIHEKEKQQSVLIKNSETHQKDLVANAQITEGLRKEIDILKKSIEELGDKKTEMEEKLTNSQKNLEETLAKQAELNADYEKVKCELEQSKIANVDNELYIEEQSVQLQEMEEQCRELQTALRQFIYRSANSQKRHGHRGKKFRASHSAPPNPSLDMYRKILAPPKSLRRHRAKSPVRKETRQSGHSDEDSENVIDEVRQSTPQVRLQQSRPKSTYGNRSLSSPNKPDQTEYNKDWIPKIVLVDSKKLEVGSENESGSISADQYAMEHVKLGDRVLIEMPVAGRKQNLPGVVKYTGPVYHKNFKTGIYAGLKLDIPVGDTNGTIDGRMYFQCLKKYGKFIKLSHILAIQNPRTQQYTRILPLGYK